jgi:hypothetical protein
MTELAPIIHRLEVPKVAEGDVVLMTSAECQTQILETLPSVERRALVKTMAYTSDQATDELVEAMGQCAANTDARVALHVELYSRIQQNKIPLWVLGGDLREAYDARMQTDEARIQTFEEAGGEFAWTGTESKLKSISSIYDVDHIKVTILDDITYIQQNNLVGAGMYRDINFVAKIQSQVVADELQLLLFDRDSADEDRIIPVGELGVIVIDSGRKGSLINDATMAFVEGVSDEAQIATSFAPTPRMTRAAKTAIASDAKVDYIYGGLNSWADPGRVMNALGGLARRGLPLREFSDGEVLLHGNLACLDETVVLTSYVHTPLGNRLNTRDIALFTRHPAAVAQGRELFRKSFPEESTIQTV